MPGRSSLVLSSSTIARSSHSLALLVVLISAPIGACVQTGPDLRAPTPEPPAPHLRDGGVNDSDGGHEATEPLPDPTAKGSVALHGILAYADQHSPVLGVARSTRSRAEAARVAASPLLPANPVLTVAVGSRFGVAGKGVDIDASLMQQIQIAGERGVRLDAAARLRDLTDAEIEEIRWLVHCNIHAAFHVALIEQERMQLAERVVAFQQEVLRVVKLQISAGEVDPLTLRLAEAEAAQADQLLVAAQQAFLVSRIRLAQLAGWPVDNPPMPGGELDAPRDPPPSEELAAIARERLPSLVSRAARVSEADARVKVAKREVAPLPSIGVQYRREGNPVPASEGPYNIVMGAVSIPIPSFQTNQGDRALAQADVTVAQAELTAAHQLLDGQIAEAHSQVVAAARRTHAYGTQILPQFEENLALLRRSFELGEIDILALSTGRERFLRIQSDALSAQLDYYVALAGLERVVGVDLWPDDHHGEVDQ